MKVDSNPLIDYISKVFMSTKKRPPSIARWNKPITQSADLQVAAATLSNRLEQNKAFRERLNADPVNVLVSLGMGPDSVRELILQDAYLREKVGAVGITAVVDCTVSCICSGACCLTCWVTSPTGNVIDKTELISPSEFGADDPNILASPLKEDLLKNIIKKGHITPNFE